MRHGVTWAPVLPDHWTSAHLRWIAEIYAGGTPDRANLEFWDAGTIPWLNSGAVNAWAITEPSELISESGFCSSSARWVPPRSVVIGLAGQGKTKGTAARLEIPATTNQSMAAIVPSSVLHYRYLHYWLVSNYQSIRNLAGGDKRDGLNLQHIGGIETPLPPVREQHAIADYLDRETAQIDTLIAKQEQLIATLRERRMAAISTAVAPNSGESGVENWFGSAPAEWHVASLKQHFEIALGKMINANTASSDEQPAPYLAAGSIQPDRLITDVTKTMTFTPSELAKYSLKFSDIVVVEGGAGYGRSHRLTRDLPGWGFQNHIARLRSSSALVSSRFATYVLKACVASGYVEANNRTATLPSLSRDVLGAIRFTYPATDEQQRICDALDQRLAASDNLIAKAERFIELSKERRAALITAAVTGQIDIPTPTSAHS